MAPSFHPTQFSGRTQTEIVFPLTQPSDITQAHNYLATHPPAHVKEPYQHQPDKVTSRGPIQQDRTIQDVCNGRRVDTKSEVKKKGLFKRIKSPAGKFKDSAVKVALYAKAVSCLPCFLYRFIFSDADVGFAGEGDWEDHDEAYRQAGRFPSEPR